jgi:DNA-binding GntR family transcriptional regulator
MKRARVDSRRGSLDNAGMKPSERSAPRYQLLAASLIGRIQSGEYPIGAQFPTEFEICAQYSVSRHTARAALARLNAMGLIARRPGAGTHVTAPAPPMRYQQEVDSIEDLLQYSRNSQLEIAVSERVVPPAEVASVLRQREDAEAIRLFGLRYGEPRHEPICTTEIFLRPARGLPLARLSDPATANRSVLKVLDLRHIHHVEQTFDAIELPARDARLLGVERGIAAMRVQRVYFGSGERVVGCAISLHPSGRFAYSMRLERRTAG